MNKLSLEISNQFLPLENEAMDTTLNLLTGANTSTQTIQPLFVEFKCSAIIEDMSVEDLMDFDTLIMDSITVTTQQDKEFTAELDSFSLKSVVSFDDDDDEQVHLNTKPKYEYHLVDDQHFTHKDIILIGDSEYEYRVIKHPSGEIMLHDFEDGDLDGWGCGTVEELNEQLKLRCSNYKVLRRVEVR